MCIYIYELWYPTQRGGSSIIPSHRYVMRNWTIDYPVEIHDTLVTVVAAKNSGSPLYGKCTRLRCKALIIWDFLVSSLCVWKSVHWTLNWPEISGTPEYVWYGCSNYWPPWPYYAIEKYMQDHQWYIHINALCRMIIIIIVIIVNHLWYLWQLSVRLYQHILNKAYLSLKPFFVLCW